MKIILSGLSEQSVVDGDGLRFTIFTQGCPHHCEGCHNPSTWSFDGGTEYDADEIVRKIQENPLLDGVTFSGGEPFMQIDALVYIAQKVHNLGLNVWSYSGYTIEQILKDKKKKRLLENIDYLVDGPFVLKLRDLSLRFRGSSNQRIINVKSYLSKGKIYE